jgi:hypothetical protein
MSMRDKMLRAPLLAMALALAAGGAGARHVAAHRALPIAAGMSACAGQTARFTVRISQGITVFSPKRLVVDGDCLAQGASITIWDYDASVSLTNGWTFVPSDANEHVQYPVLNAPCRHLLQVVVLDVAHNSRAGGNGKVYGPCQPSQTVHKL